MPAVTPRRPSVAAVAAFLVVCLLLSGIAPSVSRVLAAQAQAPGHDLCVADAAASGAPSPQAPAGHHDSGEAFACALCAVHGGTHGAPPPACALPSLASGDGVAGRVVDTGRIDPGPVLAAAPRGPPSRSA